jgi:hypothetical protein
VTAKVCGSFVYFETAWIITNIMGIGHKHAISAEIHGVIICSFEDEEA